MYLVTRQLGNKTGAYEIYWMALWKLQSRFTVIMVRPKKANENETKIQDLINKAKRHQKCDFRANTVFCHIQCLVSLTMTVGLLKLLLVARGELPKWLLLPFCPKILERW